jgi:hypothetical protein
MQHPNTAGESYNYLEESDDASPVLEPVSWDEEKGTYSLQVGPLFAP